MVPIRQSKSQPLNCEVQKFQENLLEWFSEYGRIFPWREKDVSLYERIVVEVLLQRTRAETVSAFYERFFQKFPNWEILASTSKKELEGTLAPIGLWREKAKVLWSLAKEIERNGFNVPKNRLEIEELSGVGQYVANAIELFSGQRSAPLLDHNMARVLERYFGPRQLSDIRDDSYLQELAWNVCRGVDAIEMNWGILDLGSLVCKRRRPKCEKCPLSGGCSYRKGLSVAKDDAKE